MYKLMIATTFTGLLVGNVASAATPTLKLVTATRSATAQTFVADVTRSTGGDSIVDSKTMSGIDTLVLDNVAELTAAANQRWSSASDGFVSSSAKQDVTISSTAVTVNSSLVGAGQSYPGAGSNFYGSDDAKTKLDLEFEVDVTCNYDLNFNDVFGSDASYAGFDAVQLVGPGVNVNKQLITSAYNAGGKTPAFESRGVLKPGKYWIHVTTSTTDSKLDSPKLTSALSFKISQ